MVAPFNNKMFGFTSSDSFDDMNTDNCLGPKTHK